MSIYDEALAKAFSGDVSEMNELFSPDLVKSHITAHFRKDPKTGHPVFIHDYDDSRHKHELHVKYERGDRIKNINAKSKNHHGKTGEFHSYDEKHDYFWVKFDGDKKPTALKAHHVEHLDESKKIKVEQTDHLSDQKRKQLEETRQMAQDMIETKKYNGEKPPQHLLDHIAKIDAQLKGENPPGGMASDKVFGHPEATNFPQYANLVPIVAKDASVVEKFIDRAQEHVDSLQKKIGTAEAVVRGKIPASVKQKKDAKAYLASQQKVEDKTILDMLKEETMPELNRMLRHFKNADQQK